MRAASGAPFAFAFALACFATRAYAGDDEARTANASSGATAPSAPSQSDVDDDEKLDSAAAIDVVAAKPAPLEIESVEVRGNNSTRTHVVLRYVPFAAGSKLEVGDPELTLSRYRLLGTGFFKEVELSLRRGSERGKVVLVVNVVERNTIVVNDLWLGLASDADPSGNAKPLTAYGGAAISEINLAGTGVTVGGALALAEGQIALRARVFDPEVFRSGWGLDATLLYNNALDFYGNRDVQVTNPLVPNQDYALARYKRFGGLVGARHDVGSVSNQLFLNYRLERVDATLPLAATHLRGGVREPIDFYLPNGGSVVSTLRAAFLRDTRDEPVLPTRGYQLLARAEVGVQPMGSDFSFGKLTVDLATHHQLSWGHVLRLEGNVGALVGEAPLFDRFFVGDYSDFLPDRVLELNFDRRPPANLFHTAIAEVRYGRYAGKLGAEYRIPVYRGRRTTYGIDAFASVALFAIADARDVTAPAPGYTGLAKIPLDGTANFGLRFDTAAGGITIGVANVLAFIPLRGTR